MSFHATYNFLQKVDEQKNTSHTSLPIISPFKLPSLFEPHFFFWTSLSNIEEDLAAAAVSEALRINLHTYMKGEQMPHEQGKM